MSVRYGNPVPRCALVGTNSILTANNRYVRDNVRTATHSCPLYICSPFQNSTSDNAAARNLNDNTKYIYQAQLLQSTPYLNKGSRSLLR